MTTERLGELFDAHHERLYRLARRLSRDSEDARDLVQETFLRAARSLSSLPRSAEGCEAWLVRTAVNLCRDLRRRAAVRARARLEVAVDGDGTDPESESAIRVAVQSALATLAPRRRAVVVLHEIEGLEVREVARLLRIAPVTVRWHLHVGRADLRRILGEGLLSGRRRDER
ncbi:MAG: RNA polymerase sigma factor [Acidobacteriia bacterium]|nr:RNA polymerase sigma factor [Terriglobia bacterium]